jgi:hypothetical protein
MSLIYMQQVYALYVGMIHVACTFRAFPMLTQPVNMSTSAKERDKVSQSLKARHHYGVFVVYYAPYTCETMFHTDSMLTQPVIMPSDTKATRHKVLERSLLAHHH